MYLLKDFTFFLHVIAGILEEFHKTIYRYIDYKPQNPGPATDDRNTSRDLIIFMNLVNKFIVIYSGIIASNKDKAL